MSVLLGTGLKAWNQQRRSLAKGSTTVARFLSPTSAFSYAFPAQTQRFFSSSSSRGCGSSASHQYFKRWLVSPTTSLFIKRSISQGGIEAPTHTSHEVESDFELQQIKEGAGAIWISNVYEFGNLMSLAKLFYRITGREKVFQDRIYDQIDKSFDRVQFPNIRQIIPDFKEKGCYITFATKEQAKKSMAFLSKGVNIQDKTCPVYLVQGTPFIEDLKIKPSPFLKIGMASSTTQIKLTTEMLFNELRQFGRMDSIVLDDKQVVATVKFAHTSSAIAAKNCIHWKPIGDTQFTVRYIPFSRLLQLVEVVRNPKFLIPLIGLIITLSLFLLVDPIRLASVTQQFTRGFQDEELREGLVAEEDEPSLRDDLIESLRQDFKTPPKKLIYIVTGPPGSGKSYVFRRLLHNRSLSVNFDCNIETVQEFAEALGKTIAFSPSFNAILTVVGWLESLIPGLKKSAISPSTQTQVESILRTLENAVFIISAGLPNVQGLSFPVIAFDGFHEMVERLSRNDEQSAKMLIDILMKWVAHTSRYAHIVFIGQNPFGEDALRLHPTLKKRKIVTLQIPDLSQEQSIQYLKFHFSDRFSDEEIRTTVDIVGGRMTDLQSVVSYVHAGFPLNKAIQHLIQLAENQVRLGFGNQMLGTSQKKWTQYQLWRCVKAIAEKQEVGYDKLLFWAFNGNMEAFKALTAAKLLVVERDENGKLLTKAYSPLYQRAFHNLVHKSPGLSRGLERLERKEDIAKLLEDLKRYEDELEILKNGESSETRIVFQERRKAVSDKIAYVNSKLAKKEKELQEIEDRPYE